VTDVAMQDRTAHTSFTATKNKEIMTKRYLTLVLVIAFATLLLAVETKNDAVVEWLRENGGFFNPKQPFRRQDSHNDGSWCICVAKD